MVIHAGHVNDIFADMCRLGVRRTGNSYDNLSRNVLETLDVPSAKYCFSMMCEDIKKYEAESSPDASLEAASLRTAFGFLMKTGVQCGDVAFATRVLNYVTEMGLADIEAVNVLLQRYGSSGRVSEALELFNKIILDEARAANKNKKNGEIGASSLQHGHVQHTYRYVLQLWRCAPR